MKKRKFDFEIQVKIIQRYVAKRIGVNAVATKKKWLTDVTEFMWYEGVEARKLSCYIKSGQQRKLLTGKSDTISLSL